MDSALFMKLEAASKWGMRPSECGVCSPEEDLLFMRAYALAERKMVAWERDIDQEERERNR